MFGIHYLKANPTQYVIQFVNGRKKRAGAGLSFYYYGPRATISVVPIGSADVPFIFEMMTEDFQPATVQGQLTYRIIDPELVASLLDYTVKKSVDDYVSEDPEKLPQRLINLAQVFTRGEVANRTLQDAIRSSDALAAAVTAKLVSGEAVQALGVEVLTFSILVIKPDPEMARALEAEARERLLRQSDDAIYERRNAAIEQERRIKENELNTEIAVEEKQRTIRETKAEADLAVEAKQQQLREAQLSGQIKLEEERKELTAAHSENVRARADSQAYALEATLRPLGTMPPEVLQMMTLQSAEPRLMVARALSEIAQNAEKIGQLHISPDLLQALMQDRDGQGGNPLRQQRNI